VSSFIFLASGVFPLSSFVDTITIFVLGVIKYVAQWSFVDIKIPAFPPVLLILFYLGVLVYIVAGNRQGAMDDSNKNNSDTPITYSLWPIVLLITISVVPIIIYTGIKIFEHKGIQITYLDVGQGDSAVVELPDGKVAVIDTGKNGFQTAAFLRYKGINMINALSISHADSDHSGGLRYLIDNFIVDEIWDNRQIDYPYDISEKIKIRSLQRGDVIYGNGCSITVLHPYEGFYSMHSDAADENNGSLVLKISTRKNSFLFTADIEEEAEDDIYHLGEYLKSDVMKIPHHGGRTSAHDDFYEEVSPDIAVISVGRKNIYGHPHDETLQMLSRAKIFRTDIDGAVGIRELSDGRLEVKTWKDLQFTEAKTVRDELMNFKKLFLVW
jgi:competence protein ComEC